MPQPTKHSIAEALPTQRTQSVRLKQTSADAFRVATQLYLAGEKIDMLHLAEKLGIGRATLYRWVGDRDKLLTEVIWSATKASLDPIAGGISSRGFARLDALFGQQLEFIAQAPALSAFLAHEGAAGIHLLTHPSGIHSRHVLAGIELVNAEVNAGHFRSPIDPETLIESVVGLSEHFLYADVLGGFRPQVARARAAISLLLREPEHT
jgi:AcrR family transcriptional regulator